MVTLSGISYSYVRGPAVLTEIDLDVHPGEILGVIGPNGSGKSTLLKIMAGLLAPTLGWVQVEGRRLEGYASRDRARRIAYLPQEYEFPFPFRVIEVALMGRAPYQSAFGFDTREDLAMVKTALRELQAGELAERNIQDLSGGEKQRVLIARTFAQQTPCLILDEPTSQLDLGHSRLFTERLKRKVSDGRSSIVWASHDLSLVAAVADRILVLFRGRIDRLGPPQQVIDESMLASVYGASLRVLHDSTTGRPYVSPT